MQSDEDTAPLVIYSPLLKALKVPAREAFFFININLYLHRSKSLKEDPRESRKSCHFFRSATVFMFQLQHFPTSNTSTNLKLC